MPDGRCPLVCRPEKESSAVRWNVLDSRKAHKNANRRSQANQKCRHVSNGLVKVRAVRRKSSLRAGGAQTSSLRAGGALERADEGAFEYSGHAEKYNRQAGGRVLQKAPQKASALQSPSARVASGPAASSEPPTEVARGRRCPLILCAFAPTPLPPCTCPGIAAAAGRNLQTAMSPLPTTGRPR